MSADLLHFGRQVLAAQPFSALLGTQLDRFDREGATLSLPMAPHLLQQNGFVHGGVLAYLADNALTYAGGAVLGEADGNLKTAVLTAEFKINYLRPAKDADRLLALATVVDHGKSQAVCRCDVYTEQNGQRRLCAAAQGTIRKAA